MVNFEPYGQDTVNELNRDHGAEIFLDKDAQKWTKKVTKDQQTIASYQKQVKGLQSVTSAYAKVRYNSYSMSMRHRRGYFRWYCTDII